MILIVDSGSTKTDWLAIDTKTMEQLPFETIGFNPMIQTQSFIENEISFNNSLTKLGNKIQKVYFFGAGCSTEANNEKVKNALQSNFPIAHILMGQSNTKKCLHWDIFWATKEVEHISANSY